MKENTTATIVDRRYDLQQLLGAGGMGAVYLADDRLTSKKVALKQVTTPSQQLMFSSRGERTDINLALAEEFRMLASLRHPNIVSVLDYGFDQQRQPYFTMEYIKDAQTILDAGRELPTQEQIDLILQLLLALVYLHRRGVLHRDLKPGNVLVVDGQVKVVDFGSALLSERAIEPEADTTAGTFAYMAPELLAGEPSSRASDLYAVGVMAYELFAGRHPYDTSNLMTLLNDIVSKQPDLTATGVDGLIRDVLDKLICKDREMRFNRARDVIGDLCHAADIPVPPESEQIRESFLQAAKFVGREQEMETLSGVLRGTIEGKGGAWLVGGESGVGKSRLADELRTQALVNSVLVVRGQAVSEGRSPYQVWRDPLRRLALATELEDEAAAVLKPLVPDIADLVGRQIPDPPLAQPAEAQTRLIRTLSELLSRQEQPLIVILEDLQWAGSESIAMLAQIIPVVNELPVLVLGNYRDDERPGLPEDLPGTETLKLKRLDESGIADLSASMLGQAGRGEKVVGLIQRETEGNPFFAVEVVRALAEESGELDRIATMELPETITAGGVKAVLDRRLGRVSEQDRPLLDLAAVAGRELDVEVLRALYELDLDRWLTSCAGVAVLEPIDGRWRFAHDKLREGVLARLVDEARPELYRRVAEAVEATHPDDPAQYATLAQLWAGAGNDGKELHYAALAGQQALGTNAVVEAGEYFARSLELLARQPASEERDRQELQLQVGLGAAYTATRGYGDSELEQVYSGARDLSFKLGSTPDLFPILFGLWAYALVRADLKQSIEIGEELIERGQQTGDPVMIIPGYWAMGVSSFWLGDFVASANYFREVLTRYDPAQHEMWLHGYGEDPGADCRGWLPWVLWSLGFPDQALQAVEDLNALLDQLGHAYSRAFAGSLTVSSYVEWKDYGEALQMAQDIISISDKHGFDLPKGSTALYLSRALIGLGHVEQGIAQMKELIPILQGIGVLTSFSRYQLWFAEGYLEMGEINKGLHALSIAMGHIEKTGERLYEADIYRVKGDLLLADGVDAVEVEALYQNGIAVAQKQQAKSRELRAAMRLARLWQSQGKTDEAREVLSEIYDWFSEGFDTADLKEARALLVELE